MAVSKPLLTEFGIHHTLESCDLVKTHGVDVAVFYYSIAFVIEYLW